jgi:UDP-N-acetylmuramate dehydrogenase
VTRARAIEAAAAALGDLAQRDAPLGVATTYRVGGPAALLVRAEHADHLHRVAAALGAAERATGIALPVLVVGKGSNLLVADRGFAGVVVALGDGLGAVSISGTTVRAGGAAALPVVARRSVGAGLTGFEWAVGVPGSVGGAVRMNAGGHGSDIAATLRRVRVLDLRTDQHGDVPLDDLHLAYRHSALLAEQVVTDVDLELAEGDRDEGERTLASIVRWRREHQPGGANAGSVFTNPAGESAGRLIDEAGGKGLRIGGAHVSPKHANFIQAEPGATAADVLAVMVAAARAVERSGVHLLPETRLAGFARHEIPPRWLDENPRLLIES